MELTEQEREQIEEAAVRAYAHEAKKAQDEETIAHYERNLRAKRKHYTQSTEAISAGGRRNRALAVGECVLKLLDAIEKEHFKHHFLPGTLVFNVFQDRTVDPDGIKGYRYTVAYHAMADEAALTEEEIAAEVEETRKKIEAETEEMFSEADAGEQAEDGEGAQGGAIPAEDEEESGGGGAEAGAE